MSDFGGISRVFRSTFPEAEDPAFRTNAWRDGVANAPAELVPLYPTIVHGLAHAAKADDRAGVTLAPDRPEQPETHRSYRVLYHQARTVGAGLAARGVGPGDRVLLVLPTGFEFVVAFFGAQLVGAIPVPSYPPAALERAPRAIARLGHVARSCGAGLCVTGRALRPLLGELALGGGVRELVTVESLLEAGARDLPRHTPRPEDPALIQYTSGSTDRPKGVVLSHASVVANIHAFGQALGACRTDVVASWLPLYHDMGLIGALLGATYWRVPQVLLSPMAFLADPLRWLRIISAHRATISQAPNFAYALCARRAGAGDLAGIDLSTWRVAMNGAEAVRADTMAAFAAALAPCRFRPESFLPVYGLAESSLAAAFPPSGRPWKTLAVDREALAGGRVVERGGSGAIELVGVGGAVPGHAVVIVDEHGAPVAEREVGHIVVQGPSVMDGYFGDPAATAAVLRDGALWTGDLGFVASGELYITGRAKDLIVVRGRNYYAEDLERVAAGVPEVRPGGAVAFGVGDPDQGTERVVLVCETRVREPGGRAALGRAIGEAVTGACAVPLDEVVLVPPGTIPKTPSGKAQRNLCRERYRTGDLGRDRTSRRALAGVLLRSGTGLIAAAARRLLARAGGRDRRDGGRRDPE